MEAKMLVAAVALTLMTEAAIQAAPVQLRDFPVSPGRSLLLTPRGATRVVGCGETDTQHAQDGALLTPETRGGVTALGDLPDANHILAVWRECEVVVVREGVSTTRRLTGQGRTIQVPAVPRQR